MLRNLLQYQLVDVVRNEVSAVHGGAAALDAGPFGYVAGAEVGCGVGGARVEAHTEEESINVSQFALLRNREVKNLLGHDLDETFGIGGRRREI